MKTTDGDQLQKGSEYYLENGQAVSLNDWFKTEDGKMKYLVTPYYEGEVMEFSGAGGYHHEITMDYTHEGLETIVYSLFGTEPTEKLGIQYSKKLKEIESLSMTIKLLKDREKNLKTENSKLLLQIERNFKDSVTGNSSLAKLINDQEEYIEVVKGLKQKKSYLQDSINDLNDNTIKCEELGHLRKRDFKLTCLENGGLDNWQWYSESLKDFRERYPEG